MFKHLWDHGVDGVSDSEHTPKARPPILDTILQTIRVSKRQKTSQNANNPINNDSEDIIV